MSKAKFTKAQTEALGRFATDMSSHLARLDANMTVRAALIARVTKAASNPKLSVITLHQVAQALEMFE